MPAYTKPRGQLGTTQDPLGRFAGSLSTPVALSLRAKEALANPRNDSTYGMAPRSPVAGTVSRYGVGSKAAAPGAQPATQAATPGRAITPVAPGGASFAPYSGGAAGLRGTMESSLHDLLTNGTDREGIFKQRWGAAQGALEDNDNLGMQRVLKASAANGWGPGAGMFNTSLGDFSLNSQRQRDQVLGELLGEQMEGEIGDRFQGLGQADAYTGRLAGEGLTREGFANDRNIAAGHDRTSLEGARLSNSGAMERLNAQLGFDRERGQSSDQFRFMEFGEDRNRYANENDWRNKEFDYRMGRDPVEDSFRRANLTGAYGYGSNPAGAHGGYQAALGGGSGAYGANAGASNRALGDLAGNWMLGESMRRPITPMYNPNQYAPGSSWTQRGNSTPSMGR